MKTLFFTKINFKTLTYLINLIIFAYYIFFMKKILVTGAAGFIGASLSKKLVLQGFEVIGIDNLNDYYDVGLKKDRLDDIKNVEKSSNGKFHFFVFSIDEINKLDEIFNKYEPEIVINLAAQAGVRHSLIDPHQYVQSNLVGFHNLIFLSKKYNISNFIYASSSSVYGVIQICHSMKVSL